MKNTAAILCYDFGVEFTLVLY